MSGATARARGAALLLVMWLLAMLAALVGAFALTAQVERYQGRTLAGGVAAAQAARAGIEYAVSRASSQDPERIWVPDGRPYAWTFDGARVDVSLVDESGKLDLNLADAVLLANLLRVLDVPDGDAGRLAAAIVDWRDTDSLTQPGGGAEDAQYAAADRPYGAKDAPIEGIAELEQVLGMTPDLFARLVPNITVFGGRGRPDAAYAPPAVLAALGLDPEQVAGLRARWDPASGVPPPMLPGLGPVSGGGSGTYSIESRAQLEDGRRSTLRVVVRAGGTGLPGSVYTPLSWEEGVVSR
ncbi:type II secretion system protein GspK [Luteimonas pelagia]